MQHDQQQVHAYFQRRILECTRRERELAADDRGDEAVFARVQTNVFQIFQTVFHRVMAMEDEEKAGALFLQKLAQIPQAWRDAYETASGYGKSERMHLEAVKLETAAEIRDAFLRIWGDTDDGS